MSFLNNLGGAAGAGNAAAGGLGKLIDVQPDRISSFADRIGKGMNSIAEAGGAPAGYAPPATGAPAGTDPGINNHMQLLDPEVLRGIIARFGGQGAAR